MQEGVDLGDEGRAEDHVLYAKHCCQVEVLQVGAHFVNHGLTQVQQLLRYQTGLLFQEKSIAPLPGKIDPGVNLEFLRTGYQLRIQLLSTDLRIGIF